MDFKETKCGSQGAAE